MPTAPLYLASASPRRRDLLRQIGVAFETLTLAVDESHRPPESPADYVERLARSKAVAGLEARASASTPVLAADTTVVLEGEIFGKPADAAEAIAMLCRLGGRRHEVLTAICLASGEARGARLATRSSRSEVWFRRIEEREAADYFATGEPLGKAGGYAVQGLGAVFVERLVGSFSGVMGLPLFETAQLLDAAGVPRWRGT
jgi:septum formation protein